VKNLNEEIDKIKKLMVYENGSTINEISTKSVSITPKQSDETPKNKKEVSKDDCITIKASGEFVVNVNKGSKAVTNFINNLENSIKNNPSFDKSKVKDGSMYITEITLQGFASNYYSGAIEPDFDNGWCKKWDKRGGLYDGLCSEWEIKPFSGTKKSNYKGNKNTNQKLAADRAVNAYNALKEKLTEKAKEEGIKIDPNLKPNYIKGGTIYTKDNVDENWKTLISSGKLNPGQIVLCTAKVCYKPSVDKKPEPKKGTSTTGSSVTTTTEEKDCLDKECMKRNSEGKCECPSDMKFDESTKKCVCKDKNKIKIPGDCKCKVPKKPLSCKKGPIEVKKGGRASKANNYVGASLTNSFPVGANNSITIDFDSVVVPDAFYVKYGNQEYFSGFMGSVYDGKYTQVKGDMDDSIYNNLKKMSPKFIRKNQNSKIIDSKLSFIPRNFIGELIYLKQNNGLLESINSAISNVGGKKKVDSIFGDNSGDRQSRAEKITNEYTTLDAKDNKDFKIKLKNVLNNYKSITKTNVSFTIDKEKEDFELVILVFSPLGRTIFNIEVSCD